MYRLFPRAALSLLLIALTLMPASSDNPLTADTVTSSVKLRKLHLVRPDLIPYPIYYEVYC
jgi:hypothetical protein